MSTTDTIEVNEIPEEMRRVKRAIERVHLQFMEHKGEVERGVPVLVQELCLFQKDVLQIVSAVNNWIASQSENLRVSDVS